MHHAILLALAPAFFVMALGYGAGRLRIIDSGQIQGLNALVMDFALPASLFAATASTPSERMITEAPLFAILGVVMLLVYFTWVFILRRSTAAKADTSVQALTIAFPNFAGIGLPITSAVLGPAGTVPVAVAIAAGSILISPLTLMIAEMSGPSQQATGGTGRPPVFKALRRALTKPVVLAPALGILISLSGIKLGEVVDASLLLIGESAAGVALFLTGLILSSQSFRLDWKIVAATGIGDVIRPLLTLAVVSAFPISHDVARIAILLAAMPSGFFGILFAVNYRLDSSAAGSMVIASTVFSIVTMAITIAVLFPS